ncbi:hypothetical protein CAOG_09060 [Capsaspora owczarzaki ATCC 30864]|uniref:RING-type domain-containing protein n=1 Tax=Capsaspora owczarzaki (strain ATCC 30864) TaxID=595528 RepID=A0A0D2VZP2_CAPO3|nr:hypothetical protein CAOG_09060 [Capsaspora owczarzaki ATCC 30864]KJE97337.1 hypothetical protein CAOG_009060 [Capsaspora owczarzaki ATCC 30864]|eukprot:XP_011270793.1 hypothetical protein CAOG_09060 [Capsaspora owczarzaki ATCC 30864]
MLNPHAATFSFTAAGAQATATRPMQEQSNSSSASSRQEPSSSSSLSMAGRTRHDEANAADDDRVREQGTSRVQHADGQSEQQDAGGHHRSSQSGAHRQADDSSGDGRLQPRANLTDYANGAQDEQAAQTAAQASLHGAQHGASGSHAKQSTRDTRKQRGGGQHAQSHNSSHRGAPDRAPHQSQGHGDQRAPRQALAKGQAAPRRGGGAFSSGGAASDSHHPVPSSAGHSSGTSSGNHLLNFTYGPPVRHGASGAGASYGRHDQRRHHNHHSHHHHATSFSKQQTLQTQCQMLVQSTANTLPFVTDPDALTEWSTIEEVRVLSGNDETASCPICLCHPIAAKMAQCGHVFCWACVLQYISFGERPWRKCPICFEAIHVEDLRSAVSIAKHTPAVGEMLTLTLMARDKNCTIPVPVSATAKYALADVYIAGQQEEAIQQHCRVLRITPAQVLDTTIAREKTELMLQYEELVQTSGTADPQLAFIAMAQAALQQRESQLTALLSVGTLLSAEFSTLSMAPAAPVSVSSSAWSKPQSSVPTSTESAFSDEEDDDQVEQSAAADHEPIPSSSSSAPAHSHHSSAGVEPDTAYFYQASDGQRVFMHPINARCLMFQNGNSLAHCPPTIRVRVLENEAHIQTEETRKRFRVLGHLAQATEFVFCEVDLNDMLNSETRRQFGDELAKRKQRRSSRIRQEHQMEKRLEQEARRQHQQALIDTRSLGDFPAPLSMSFDPSQLPALPGAIPAPEPVVAQASTEPKPASYIPPSFAQAAKCGVLSNHDANPHVSWANGRAKTTLLNDDSSRAAPSTNVSWAGMARTPMSGLTALQRSFSPRARSGARNALDGDDSDEEARPRDFRETFAESLWTSLSVPESVDGSAAAAAAAGTNAPIQDKKAAGKKGKKGATVLFSTGGTRKLH